ncbi:Suppressor of glycerol defect protein 1 [Exophiala dermatitidis]
MSRHRPGASKGLKLPFALQKELGLDENRHGGRRQHGAVKNRKEQRKAERQERRHNIRGSKPHQRRDEFDEDDSEEEEDDNLRETAQTAAAKARNGPKRQEEDSKPRSILKRPRQPSPTLSEPESELSSVSRHRSTSPGLVLDPSSQAFKERMAQDDAEISALEKKLGLNKRKKLPKSFVEDGLDELLAGLDGEERGVKRKTEEQEWLERKRRKANGQPEESDDEAEEDDFDFGGGDSDDESLDGIDAEGYDSADMDGLGSDDDLDDEMGSDEDFGPEEDDDFEGFGSENEDGEEAAEEEEDEHSRPPAKRVRENPYVAPVSSNTTTAKYIPPSMRKAQLSSEGPSLERLKRQVQGHLNKLSEANLVSILGEVEKIYQSNPRQDVTTVLIDLLLTTFCNKSTLQNTFVILHAAFAAAVYKVVGVDFGAELLSQLVERFEQYHGNGDAPTGNVAAGKESLNLISLLSNLFTFHMVSSTIIFDHIRLLLSKLSESNTEILLRLVRDCGPQLRQDDPSSLKAIVQMMQKEAARMTAAGEQMSVRTKFMIETITDLKNNKMKAATNNAGLSSEHITQMRKVLGSLNNRASAIRASEPLRISRDDIKNSDKKGKWWLVGASWKGNGNDRDHNANANTSSSLTLNEGGGSGGKDSNTSTVGDGRDDANNIDLLSLARQYGMNTDVRRSIFVALLSAVDCQDAFMRLLKLRLKRSQEQEIPRVLLRCAAGENPYNHYYTLVAKRLCQDKRMRKAFQFALWGFFRRMGETGDLDDEGDEQGEQDNVEIGEIANLARLYAHLILDGAETLGVLKVLDLAYVKEKTAMFVELLLIVIMTEAEKNSNSKKASTVLEKVFGRTVESPQVIRRLQFFIKNNVRSSDLVAKGDRDAVKRGCKIALETLRRLDMVDTAMEA